MSDNRERHTGAGEHEEEIPAIRVECYAGYRAEESPRRFFIGKREVGVVEIIDRWLDPAHSYYKVRADDGGIYILRFEPASGSWNMILFNSGTLEEMRLSST